LFAVNWLIAEDETDIRNLVGIMCTVWGHTPLAFESGQKVWDWLDQVESGAVTTGLPDFALMDIRMPGRRGSELAQRIRTIDKIKNIPIVLMTAFVLGDEEIARLKEENGVDHVINKPLPDFDALGVVLHDIIKKKQESVEKQAESAGAPQESVTGGNQQETASGRTE
jgi:two-component system, NarL family, sensor histidine kinase EvgS